jgi:hypothetical protein
MVIHPKFLVVCAACHTHFNLQFFLLVILVTVWASEMVSKNAMLGMSVLLYICTDVSEDPVASVYTED